MRYKPTLGGLKKAQAFLESRGYPMPIFQEDIYGGVRPAGLRSIPGTGQAISIDEAIRERGAMCEVKDVRLANEQGDKFVQFSATSHFGLFTGLSTLRSGWDVVLEFHQGDDKFKAFMESADGRALTNVCRWGEVKVNALDRCMFRYFPEAYAKEVFA